MEDIVIVSGSRTPFGKFGGALSNFSATELGSLVIKESLKKSNINKSEVNEVIMGNVLSAGLGQNISRQATIGAGLPNKTLSFHVNEVCCSSLRAVITGIQSIKSGDAKVAIAGGMESMSNSPYILAKARFGYRLFDGKIIDSMLKDGLWDVYTNQHMGMAGESIAKEYNISREYCDKFALKSHKKASKAIQKGKFSDEILSIEINPEKENMYIFDKDEGIRKNTSLEKLKKLKSIFKNKGVLTAGNSSQISDGSVALVMMGKSKAEQMEIEPLVTIKGYDNTNVKPEDLMVAPIKSVNNLMNKMNLNIEDIDLFEHNEAFSSASIVVMNELDIDEKKFNVNGGAISIGHPIGSSGARILLTLANEMIRKNKSRGVATICAGGGNAISIVLER